MQIKSRFTSSHSWHFIPPKSIKCHWANGLHKFILKDYLDVTQNQNLGFRWIIKILFLIINVLNMFLKIMSFFFLHLEHDNVHILLQSCHCSRVSNFEVDGWVVGSVQMLQSSSYTLLLVHISFLFFYLF